MSKFKNALLAAVGLLLLSNVLLLTQRNTAQAQSPGVNLAQLVAQVNSLQSTVSGQAATISSLKTQEQSDIKATQSQEKNDVTNLNGGLAALQTLTASFSLSSDPNVGGTNTLLTIKGVNVQIVNGLSGTETANGLGNLIVGYDEKDPQFTQNRTGSHNLVVGMGNNYLSYGGLIAGQSNLISAPYATVTGGYLNVAKSGHASVSGGSGNVASGGSASVSGGQNNVASADYTAVSGGIYNIANFFTASVSGGYSNTASGYDASVSGGYGNTASGADSAVSGGYQNTAGGANSASVSDATVVSGGSNLTENRGTGGWKAGSQSSNVIPLRGNFVSD